MSGDYEALTERLQTLPDQLSYDIMVSAGTRLVKCGEVSKMNATLFLPFSYFHACTFRHLHH